MATKTLSGDGWRVTADEETFELVIDARPGPLRTLGYFWLPLLSGGVATLVAAAHARSESSGRATVDGSELLLVGGGFVAALLLVWWFQVRPAALRAFFGDETIRVLPDRVEHSWGTARRRESAADPRRGDLIVLAEPLTLQERFDRRKSNFLETRDYANSYGQVAVHCPATGHSVRLGTELSVEQAQALIDACRAADLPTRGLRFTPLAVWPPPRAGS